MQCNPEVNLPWFETYGDEFLLNLKAQSCSHQYVRMHDVA